MKNHFFSIIITSKNSANLIHRCLKSIKLQSYKSFEIIVVDNYSSDNTIEIAKKFTSLVFKRDGERSAQRNFGAEKASGDWLIFLDSDMEISKDVVMECNNKIHNGYEALYIPEITNGDSLWAKLRTYERSFYNETPIDAVRCIKKTLFRKVGGFDEFLIGPEDWDLNKRVLNIGKTTIIKSPLFNNEQVNSPIALAKKKIYYDKGLQKYIKKWGRSDPYLRTQLDLKSRFIDIFFSRKNISKIISKPHFFILTILNKLIFAITFKLLSYSQLLNFRNK